MRKIIVWGASRSGKTVLVQALSKENFTFKDKYIPTPGANFTTISSGTMNLQFWDLGGDKRYDSMLGIYLTPNTDIILYCVDLSKPIRQEKINADLELIMQRTSNFEKSPDLILVGTKCESSKVTNNVPDSLSNKFQHRFKVSSKDKTGLSELLEFFHLEYANSKKQADNKSDIQKALDLVHDNSEIGRKLCQLNWHISSLSSEKKSLIGKYTLELLQNIQKQQDSTESVVNKYEKDCLQCLGNKHEAVKAALYGLIVAVVVTVIAAALGFGIGLLAGAWAGPAAFISAVVTGGIAANAVMGTSALIGSGLGIFSGKNYYTKQVEVPNIISAIAKEAQNTFKETEQNQSYYQN